MRGVAPDQRNHRAFDADRARAPIENHSTASPNPARTCSAVVGESSVNRFALGAASGMPGGAQQLESHRMRGHPQPDARQSRSHRHPAPRRLRHDDRQRPGPEPPRQLLRRLGPLAAPGLAPARCCPHERSADSSAAGPSPRRSSARRRHPAHIAPNPYTVSVGNATSRPARNNSARVDLIRQFIAAAYRSPSCRSCARPARHGSSRPDPRPARAKDRRSKASTADPSPAGTAPST